MDIEEKEKLLWALLEQQRKDEEVLRGLVQTYITSVQRLVEMAELLLSLRQRAKE